MLCRAAFAGLFALMLVACGRAADTRSPTSGSRISVCRFSADVTIPPGHRCMGILPTKSRVVADPLEAHGFVLVGAGKPIVFVAVDWCEIRNGAYDEWRDALAGAAGTTRERVLVTALHQHDAPVTDSGAARLLREVGLPGELYDEEFHAAAVARTAAALTESLASPQPVTHVGTGAARIEGIASNRRVVHENGRVSFSRGSRSGGHPFFSSAPVGEIDPMLRTISLWNGDEPLVALSVYATHPMSRYGQGIVSADFVGLPRRRRQQALPDTLQIYASGCSGDVTAGKFNDGSDDARERLIERLEEGMERAWQSTELRPLSGVALQVTPLKLEFSRHPELDPQRLRQTLEDGAVRTEDRILAAMGLSSWQRVQSGQPIDFVSLTLGHARLILFPGESFVGYQLMAQAMRPEEFIVSVGYGECWTGYIPTNAAFADGFHDKWLWVQPGAELRIRDALDELLSGTDRR